MNIEARESVLFYRSFWDAIKELEEADQVAMTKAIMEYGLDGVEPEISGVLKSLFSLIRPQIDANNRRYQNGKGGGRRRNQEESKNEPNQNQTRTKPEPKHNQTGTKPEPNHNQSITKPEPKEKVKEKEKEKEKVKENTFAPGDESPCAGSFLLNDGTEFEVSENDVVTYQQLYPAVDVRQELRNIAGWCLSNPKNRKTRSGAKRFLNAWLTRKQNKARGTAPAPKSVPPPNRFHNFDQRNTNYEELLNQMRKAEVGK